MINSDYENSFQNRTYEKPLQHRIYKNREPERSCEQCGVAWTTDQLAVGCRQYPISRWLGFSDQELDALHDDARDFRLKYFDIIETIIGIES